MDVPKFARILLKLYFVNLALYSILSLLDLKNFETIFWFLRIPILIGVYLLVSVKRQWIYILGLLLYQAASMFIASNNDKQFFLYGSISSILFKLCLCILVFNLVKPKNRLAVSVATIPFFVIYLYIVYFVHLKLSSSLNFWIINGFLTSFLGGVSVISYLNNPAPKEYWLLITTLLFLAQTGAFFINKFYLQNEGITQMVILFYGASHYTFYKFLILKENEETIKN